MHRYDDASRMHVLHAMSCSYKHVNVSRRRASAVPHKYRAVYVSLWLCSEDQSIYLSPVLFVFLCKWHSRLRR